MYDIYYWDTNVIFELERLCIDLELFMKSKHAVDITRDEAYQNMPGRDKQCVTCWDTNVILELEYIMCHCIIEVRGCLLTHAQKEKIS